ncbi:hypothetical protein CVT26_000664 [Gymnopilus dilepis]|uniref:Uncharacterized protein n=1 Tax=Gymnopilus dilepis TaxID=231916 RepID=A0A409WEF1_9AGAR|nr:hypothetical protein CVT26_000664 [Gymnopilus dilepis]
MLSEECLIPFSSLSSLRNLYTYQGSFTDSDLDDDYFHKVPFKTRWQEEGPPIASVNPHFDFGELLSCLLTIEPPPSSPLGALSSISHSDPLPDCDPFDLSPLTSPEASDDEWDGSSASPSCPSSLVSDTSIPLQPYAEHQAHACQPAPSVSPPKIGKHNLEGIAAATARPLPRSTVPSPPLSGSIPGRTTEVLLSDHAGDVEEERGEASSPPQSLFHKKRQRASNHQNRNLKRQQERRETFSHYEPRANPKKDSAPPIQINLETEKCSKSAAAFIGLNDVSGTKKALKVEDFVGENSKYKFDYVPWNGKKVAFLAGQPDEEKWPLLMQEAAEALESNRPRLSIPKSELVHRRGAFPAVPCGVSHGGGSTCPGNLRHNKETAAVVEELCGMDCFRRLAGFASSVMASKVPKLYQYYVEHLAKLHERHPELKRLFPSSVFAAASFNFGPRTTCRKHKDFANLPFGLCSVTALGNFDPRAGGHLVLWECKLVIEFPAGSTILLPSAIIAHSNTAIQSNEQRYSFAQYTAGGLFRWVSNECMLSSDYYASLSAEELEVVERANLERWRYGLSLFEQLETSS